MVQTHSIRKDISEVGSVVAMPRCYIFI